MTALVLSDYNQFSGSFRLVQFGSMLPCPYTISEHFLLLHIRRGSLQITIDDTTVTLHQGDVCLTVPFVFYKNEPAPDAQVDMMLIAPYICPEASQVLGNRRPLRPYLRCHELTPLVPQLLDVIGANVKELIKPIHERGQSAAVYSLQQENSNMIKPYLAVLLLELSKKMTLVEIDERNTTATQKILKYCTANFNQDITRHSVSRDCDVSLGAISQTFNRLGTSFRDYVNNLRINRAYQLLTTTKKPITEIIYECGYANQGTFNRNFQLQFGKSPRDIRHGR